MTLQLFQYDFMIRAFITGTMIAIIAPLIGNFLVIRRYSLFADSLAHVSFLSIAIAFVAGISPIGVSVIGSVVAAVALEKLRISKKVSSETSLALFLAGSLALATIILSFQKTSVNIGSILFGSITTIPMTDLFIICSSALVGILLMAIFFKEFFMIAFDEEYSLVKGIPVGKLNYLLMILAAITISISITVIGVLLISALMVIPVIAAHQFKKSFRISVGISIVVALMSVWIGLTVAFYADLPAGGTIVLITIGFFMISSVARRFIRE